MDQGQEMRGGSPEGQENECKHASVGNEGREPLESPRELECEKLPRLNGNDLS